MNKLNLVATALLSLSLTAQASICKDDEKVRSAKSLNLKGFVTATTEGDSDTMELTEITPASENFIKFQNSVRKSTETLSAVYGIDGIGQDDFFGFFAVVRDQRTCKLFVAMLEDDQTKSKLSRITQIGTSWITYKYPKVGTVTIKKSSEK